jgi:hypothetical protein
MRRHCGDFVLHVLCYDEETLYWCLDQLGDVLPDRASALLVRHPQLQLQELPTPRTRIDEKLCTWRWFYTRDVVETWGAATQLDSDLMFFSSPEPVFEEIGDAKFAVLPHNLARIADHVPGITFESHGQFGTYNGGWSYFADTEALGEMCEYVRQWCHPGFREHADGRRTYGDQGYLDLVQERWKGHVIQHPGACAAPWNLNRWIVVTGEDGTVMLDGRPLVSFHFQGFRWAKRTHELYRVNDDHDRILYVPYRLELAAVGDGTDALLTPCNVCGGSPGSCPHPVRGQTLKEVNTVLRKIHGRYTNKGETK